MISFPTFHSSGKFRLEQGLESLAVLGKLLDTFVQLVEGHLVLEECPAELRLVVNVSDLGKVLGFGSCGSTRASDDT